MQYPLLFASDLGDYLSLIENLIVYFEKFEGETILKCGMFALYRATKQFTYYATPNQYILTLTKNKV